MRRMLFQTFEVPVQDLNPGFAFFVFLRMQKTVVAHEFAQHATEFSIDKRNMNQTKEKTMDTQKATKKKKQNKSKQMQNQNTQKKTQKKCKKKKHRNWLVKNLLTEGQRPNEILVPFGG